MVYGSTQHFPLTPQVKEFFLARQPILDRNQHLVGYKLLFRRAESGQSNAAGD
jgi:c-di-GMP phosphodiesterase